MAVLRGWGNFGQRWAGILFLSVKTYIISFAYRVVRNDRCIDANQFDRVLSPIFGAENVGCPDSRRVVKNRNHSAIDRTIRTGKVSSPRGSPNSESPSSFLDRLFRGRTGSSDVYALLLSTYPSNEIQLR